MRRRSAADDDRPNRRLQCPIRWGRHVEPGRPWAPLARSVPRAVVSAAMDERRADGADERGVSGAADRWPLSAREAAAVLGVSERTVRRAIARGDLPATL